MTQERAFLNRLNDPERFQTLGDGWIRDHLLGIEWGPSSDEIMDFKKAEKYCQKQGGRLPESQELMSLIDHSKDRPACLLEDMKYDDWYWTGIIVAGDSARAWCVYFYNGYVDSAHKDNDGCARPCRASQ